MKEYLETLRRIYYKLDNPRKFNQKDFMKEIRLSYHYSRLIFCQNLLMEIKEGKLTKDELYGELQIGLKDAYESYKKDGALIKIPNLDFDEFFLSEK